jgi:hypothetical protein
MAIRLAAAAAVSVRRRVKVHSLAKIKDMSEDTVGVYAASIPIYIYIESER